MIIYYNFCFERVLNMARAKLTYKQGQKIPISINLYLPPDLDQRMRAMAEAEDTSINKVVTRLLRLGLEVEQHGRPVTHAGLFITDEALTGIERAFKMKMSDLVADQLKQAKDRLNELQRNAQTTAEVEALHADLLNAARVLEEKQGERHA
jgi:predicted HicB family RNase H-like nuclease